MDIAGPANVDNPADNEPEQASAGQAPLGAPGAPPPELPEVPEPSNECDPDDVLVNAGGKWGPFRITGRPSESPHGRLQAHCVFHAKNHKTGCKKSMGIAGKEQSDKVDCLRRLKQWCVQHERFKRQRRHNKYQPKLHECDTMEQLDAAVRRIPLRREEHWDDELLDGACMPSE